MSTCSGCGNEIYPSPTKYVLTCLETGGIYQHYSFHNEECLAQHFEESKDIDLVTCPLEHPLCRLEPTND